MTVPKYRPNIPHFIINSLTLRICFVCNCDELWCG